MGSELSSFDDLLRRCRAGDESAARLVVEMYSSRLMGVARKLLHQRVQRRVDHEDVVQSALFTFFRRVEGGEFLIRDADDIWKLLVTITIRKAQKQGRRNLAEQRDVTREVSGEWLANSLARDPGPSEAIVFTEVMDSLANHLEKDKYNQILECILAGESKEDIATSLGISKRTVDRVLSRTRSALEKMAVE